MNTLRKVLTASLLVILAANVAAMGDGKGKKENMPAFSDFDLNGDGTIVEQEFNEGHAKRMSEMAAEGRQMKQMKECPGFAGIDTDGNAGINEQEFASHQAEHQKQMQHKKMSHSESHD